MKIDFRPVSQETYDINHSSPERFEGTMWLGKGSAGPPVHIHPYSTEELELTEGKLSIYRNGSWEIIESGTRWIIPAGEPHTFKSVPDAEATVRFRVSPPRGFEGFLKDTEDLIRSGKLTSYSNLNGLIWSSMLVMKYKDTMVPASRGLGVAMRVMNGLGKILGKRIDYGEG